MFKPSYYEYITEKQLENLRLYKYASVDKSYLSKYVLKHYWDFVITLFPAWIAPNLITLIGLFFMIFNVIIICIWSPDLSPDAPNWIHFSFAAGLWLYSTFDNVDGRQARRTATSSPLGELFDHGCDAVNCTFVALLQTAALGLGHSWLAIVLLFVTIAGFYLSTAEEYYTGVLYLGYVNGPTEGILVTCLAFVWSGIYGASSWHVSVQEKLPWLNFLPDMTFAELFVWAMTAFFLITHLPVCIYSIAKACNEKGLFKRNVFFTIFVPLVIPACFIWVWLSHSTIFKEKHVIAFVVYIGILFGEMASDIILAHLTKSAFPRFRKIYISLLTISALVVLGQRFGYNYEYELLMVLCLVTAVSYIVRAVKIINAFCSFLNIRCLVIPSQQTSLPKTRAEEETESLLITQEEGTSYNTF
ncbi:MAG: hypothetical protein EXX96DRAFT_583661 [Benjaminiella poitrasii]|nr:MAG: hypothetical protein EXX96DRAFT_583661 [Benjaminiella poitrasii]